MCLIVRKKALYLSSFYCYACVRLMKSGLEDMAGCVGVASDQGPGAVEDK